MLNRQSDHAIASSSEDFERFMRAIEKKNLLEILSYADREATAAWRAAFRLKSAAKAGETTGQYARILEELMAFLRAAVAYRPADITGDVFDRFVQLRKNVSSRY